MLNQKLRSCLHVFINDREVKNNDVLIWENERAIQVLKKLGVTSQNESLDLMRSQLLMRKFELGHKGLKQLLARELKLADIMGKITEKISLGHRRFCKIEIYSERGSAEQFVEWFHTRGTLNDETAMLSATPDHYIISTINGVQEVVETNGGSPFAARFLIDYHDLSNLKSIADPAYDLQVAGVAKLKSGLAVGGVRHQFRNEGTGFRAKLVVEYPLFIMPSIIKGHQWHLASEFSNWILASFAHKAL